MFEVDSPLMDHSTRMRCKTWSGAAGAVGVAKRDSCTLSCSGGASPKIPVGNIGLDQRHIFDRAAEEIYMLMNTDPYQRFLKSEAYQTLLNEAPMGDKSSELNKVQRYFPCFELTYFISLCFLSKSLRLSTFYRLAILSTVSSLDHRSSSF